MQNERTRLKHDYAIIGDGIPMMSASQIPLCVDDVVYSGTAGIEGYSSDKRTVVEVTSWRVIQLNFQDRYVRIRNTDGCEMTVSFSEGCARLKLYHNFKDLRDFLLKTLDKEAKVTEEKIAERSQLLDNIKLKSKELFDMQSPESPANAVTTTVAGN